MLLHVHIADIEVRVRSDVVNKLAVDKLERICFMNSYVRGIFFSLRRLTLQHSRPVHISAIERKKEKVADLVVACDILTVTESLNQGELRVARQTLTLPRLELHVLVMSTASNLRVIVWKPLTRGKRKTNCRQMRSKHPSNSTLSHLSNERLTRTGPSTIRDGDRTWRGVRIARGTAWRTIRTD